MEPVTAADVARATARATRPELPEGRPTLERTNKLRERYWHQFVLWLAAENIAFESLLAEHTRYIDEINAVLTAFGRALYRAGRPYNQYSETINCLTSRKPGLRRWMQGSWDLAFQWMSAEPTAHHVSMPWQVLSAMTTVCLMWGWLPLAGALCLMWGALLRPGEFLNAYRVDLLLPRDVEHTICFGLLAIKEPKTRQTGARHQAGKLDVPDLLAVVDLAFGRLPSSSKLWMWSGQTLRNRFSSVLAALRLPTERKHCLKPLDPGSLRAGGATWHLQVSEDGEYCRRKGRWLSQKVMEVYVQETTALLYLKHVSPDARELVLALAQLFPQVVNLCSQYASLSLPPSTWHILLQHETLGQGGKVGMLLVCEMYHQPVNHHEDRRKKCAWKP